MAFDPRLMMVDYAGGLAQAGQNIGRAAGGIRMRGLENLAGKAMMGDPMAMSELEGKSPAMAVQVQDRLSKQRAQQEQSQYQRRQMQLDYATALSQAQDKFGKVFSRAKTFEEAQNIHKRLLATDPLYQIASAGGTLPDGTEVPADEEFTQDDFLNARAQFGSGFGDMDLRDLVALYEGNPVVQDYLKAKNSASSIKDAYDRLQENPGDQAAQFNVAKAAIQMIESGVVRPEEFVAAAGFAMPAGLSPGETMSFLETKLKGALTPDQVSNLARMGIAAFNAKASNVQELQNSMIEAGLGAYDPSVVFATAPAKPLDAVSSGASTAIAPPPKPKTDVRTKATRDRALVRGEELEAQGLSDAEISAKLKEEGLL